MSKLRDQIVRALFGLQFRTTLLLTGVVLAATGLTGATYFRISARVALEESKRHARDMAKALAVSCRDPVSQSDRGELLAVAEPIVRQGDIAYLVFTDVSGEVLASYQHGRGNFTHLMMEGANQVSVEPINRPQLAMSHEAGPRIDIVYPVRSQPDLNDDSFISPTVGYVRLGVSLSHSQARLSAVVRSAMGLAIGITLLMVPLGYEVVRNILGPINNLSEAARSIAKGDLGKRVEARRRDEIGELGRTFNTMADQLAHSHNQLVKLNAELEDRVLQRTTALEEANRKLREMAARDSLTGLYNRRHFNDLLSQLFAESTRYGTDLTCLMVDLDNFKRVNDSLGHQTGDELLRLTADVIRRSIRESDVAVRYGGDEFAILLPQTTLTEARASAERMLVNYRAAVQTKLPEAAIASLSIGLASCDQDQPTSATELVNLADEALYLSKAGGKNRIMVVRPVSPDGYEV